MTSSPVSHRNSPFMTRRKSGNRQNYVTRFGFTTLLVLGIAVLLAGCESGEDLTSSVDDTQDFQQADSTQSVNGTTCTSTSEIIAIPAVGVEASDYEVKSDGTVASPEYAIDGVASSGSGHWASLGLPQWITVDLGASHTLAEARVAFHKWEQGRIYTYDVQVSDDNENWITTVENGLSENAPWSAQTFAPVNARYLRIVVKSANDTNWASIREIEAVGSQSSQNTACAREITLSWDPVAGANSGYTIFYGRNATEMSLVASEIDVNDPAFDPYSPLVHFMSEEDLGLANGETVCFSVQAHSDSASSPISKPVCGSV